MDLAALKGKVAVITGASRGLGAGMAHEFNRHGIRLGLCSRSAPALPDGPDVVTEQLDVRDGDAIAAFADRTAKQLGPIDLWINNAGVLEPMRPLRDIRVEELRDHLDINVVGVFNGMQTYLRYLRGAAHEGVLINISSGAAVHAYAGWSAYCAGKAAVDLMTECVALEEAGGFMRVHSVAPGVIDTDMQELIRNSTADDFPEVERFREMKRDESFNSCEFVAARLLEIAFDPSASHDEVVLRLPAEN